MIIFSICAALCGCSDLPPEGPAGPSATAGHAIAVDEVTGDLIYFGGVTSTIDPLDSRSTTWRWRSAAGDATFERVTGEGPLHRYGHGMVFDRRRNAIVMFGGASHCSEQLYYCDDTWILEGDTWRELQSERRPEARFSHAMAHDSRRGRIVVFGGVGENADCATGACQKTWIHADDRWSELD